MKRFFIWLTIVLVTVVAADFLLGVAFSSYLKNNTLPGDYESIEKVMRHNDNDILVLGSSVALNSLNTKAIEARLGLKTFNGGGNGQTFPFFLTMLKAAVKTHAPKTVILCFQPSALSSEGLGNRYNFLAPYYGTGIADIDDNIDNSKAQNKYLMKIASYKLNTIWFRILLYNFITPDIKGENGHVAKPLPPVFPTKHEATIEAFSKERLCQLTQFFEICKKYDIKVVILFPPEYLDYTFADENSNVIKETIELAKKYNVDVYDDTRLAPFAASPELFYDNAHINIDGTKIYTDTVINRLKR